MIVYYCRMMVHSTWGYCSTLCDDCVLLQDDGAFHQELGIYIVAHYVMIVH